MATYRSAGVYVDESGVATGDIAEATSGVVGFVGYTEFAHDESGGDLVLAPTRVTSLVEFERHFGRASADPMRVTLAVKASAQVTPMHPHYLLHYAVRSFFDNGGAACFIASVGRYRAPPVFRLRGTARSMRAGGYGLQDGLEALAEVDGPALLVIPEAVRLPAEEYAVLVQAMLSQCGERRDRFAILDLHAGTGAVDPATLAANRELLGSGWLAYGAAYYPFVRAAYRLCVNQEEGNVTVKVGTKRPMRLAQLRTSDPAAYAAARGALARTSVLLPASGAVAGVYAATDSARGVWKAPANVALAGVREPAVALTDLQREAIHVDPAGGKSVNMIRRLPGRGTMVWGARTLAANDSASRYVPVRRLLIQVEASVARSTKWTVFEPNTAATWSRVRAGIEAYLNRKWREGALAGTMPQEAYFVRCGAGSTMTERDVAQGRLVIEIGMAALAPAEFTILRITQQVTPSAGDPPAEPQTLLFSVRSGSAQAAFSEVTGLGSRGAPVEYRRVLPAVRSDGLHKLATLTLKHGVTRAEAFARWLGAPIGGGGRAQRRRDLTITLLDERRCTVARWRVRRALPVKFEAPVLHADGSEIAIESVELTHEGIELLGGNDEDD